MKVYVNGTDISNYINETSYKVNSSQMFTEWVDGNFVTHRKAIRKKVSGEFVVGLYGQDGMTTKEFLKLWNSAVKDGMITINLYVENEAKNEIIEAFYEIEVDSHRQLSSGEYIDLISIKLEEA